MTKLSRRHLVAGGLAGAGASVMPGFIKEANAAVMVRHNLTSAPGQAMLKKYAQAVKMMMALPASNPLSWTFQWYTHAVPTNTTKAAAIAATFGAPPSPQKALAQSMWDTCQAHFNAANEPFFLPWHRMYVCYFENIVRKILGDPSFTLPYWNYTVPAGYRLPPEFRMQNDPTFGSLFRPNRKAVVNAGQPIFNGMPGGVASDLSAAPALAENSYLPVGVQQGFNQQLDFGLHGNIHVFVGNSQGMGQVPWAANDPIFWMHHCNIDRIWVSWNAAAGHTNPNTAGWLNRAFVFANASGQAERPIVKDYTTTRKCNYRYDALLSTPSLVAAVPSPSPSAAVAAAPPVCPCKDDRADRSRCSARAGAGAVYGVTDGQRCTWRLAAGGKSRRAAGKSSSLSCHQQLQGRRAAGSSLPRLPRPAGFPAVRSDQQSLCRIVQFLRCRSARGSSCGSCGKDAQLRRDASRGESRCQGPAQVGALGDDRPVERTGGEREAGDRRDFVRRAVEGGSACEIREGCGAHPSPISLRISAVCCPSRGAGLGDAIGSPSSMIGVRTPGTKPALAASVFGWIFIPRCLTCGSSNT